MFSDNRYVKTSDVRQALSIYGVQADTASSSEKKNESSVPVNMSAEEALSRQIASAYDFDPIKNKPVKIGKLYELTYQ